ncbi:hypothetical protein N7520_007122 [Penicillium odoratum]|uniref:uncharacterized protein n=1 Tax=Penicillium odoratum TaxID=1167516 RepID=UPI002546F479|nr:uncharacterized protein N7520_007122 [Penicillium odoratum]KAJ5759966.1 hypothetical protein N7520_007122 [Penicillium odoratum]
MNEGMNVEGLTLRSFPDADWQEHNLSDLETCLSELRTSCRTHNTNVLFINPIFKKPDNIQSINFLVKFFRLPQHIIDDRELNENDGYCLTAILTSASLTLLPGAINTGVAWKFGISDKTANTHEHRGLDTN